MDLLFSIRDLGIPEPLPDSIDSTVRVALTDAIHTGASGPARRSRSLRQLLRRGTLIPVALVVTTATAAAAAGLIPVRSIPKFAHKNAHDPATRLFQKSVPFEGGTVVGGKGGTVVPHTETVIRSSVRTIAKPIVPGVGAVQFWVGDTKQHGYCVALRLPNGNWAGLEDVARLGGSVPGCQPTRAQVGAGALILSGFDYTDAEVPTKSGKGLDLVYCQIVAPGHPTKVRDDFSGVAAPVIDGKYFMLVTQAGDSGNIHLVALDAAGKVIADERKPLPGTPTVKCIGRYDVRHDPVPGTKRTETSYDCHRWVRVIAK